MMGADDIIGDINGWEMVALALNYAIFGAIFLWRYLNPEKWAKWLVESASSYFIIYMATTFLVFMLIAVAASPLSIGIFGIFAILFLLMIWKEFTRHNNGVLPVIFYLGAILQETYYAYTSPDESLLIALMLWYFIGAFILLAFSKPIGTFIDRLNPELSKRQMKCIKRIYGPEAPQIIVLEDGTVHGNYASGPGGFAALGLIYPVWMLLKLVVLLLL